MNYSPTQTERFLTCPRLWDLAKRWTPRGESKQTMNMLLGTSIHKGMATRGAGGAESVCYAEAQAILASRFQESDDWTLDGAVKLVNKGLKVGLDNFEDLIAGGTVVGVELNLGYRVIDLLHRTPEGRLVVTDYKYVHRLASEYVSERASEVEHSWQLHDYASAVEKNYGEIPERIQQALLIGAPKAMFRLVPVTMSVERLEQWRASALQVWKRMDGCENSMNLRACHNKGLHFGKRCPMYDACHDPSILGNESKMGVFYDRRER